MYPRMWWCAVAGGSSCETLRRAGPTDAIRLCGAGADRAVGVEVVDVVLSVLQAHRVSVAQDRHVRGWVGLCGSSPVLGQGVCRSEGGPR